MHKLKELYSSPLSELLVVRFEENILSYNDDNHTEYLGEEDGGDL